MILTKAPLFKEFGLEESLLLFPLSSNFPKLVFFKTASKACLNLLVSPACTVAYGVGPGEGKGEFPERGSKIFKLFVFFKILFLGND